MHGVLYNQENFIIYQVLILVLVREILLCETSDCMRGVDIEVYKNFNYKRQVLDTQDVGSVNMGVSLALCCWWEIRFLMHPLVSASCYYVCLSPQPSKPHLFHQQNPSVGERQ